MSRPVLEVIEAAKPMHCPCGYPGCSRNELRADLTEAHNRVSVLVRAARSVTATGDERTLRMAVEELRAALAGVL